MIELNKCKIDAQSTEHWSFAILNNPVAATKIKILNLSHNNIAIDGCRHLAKALEQNTSIQFLDLSQNQLQVYGTQMICKSLHKNKTLKALSLFKNRIDVDGARAVKSLLLQNSKLEYLDLGHNRIRTKGLEAISEGMNRSDECNIITLGLRMNFISDDAIGAFFQEVIFSGQGNKLQNLYIKQNNISHNAIACLSEGLKKANKKIFIDLFESYIYHKEDKRSRTCWFAPVTSNMATDYSFRCLLAWLMQEKSGLVKQIRLKYGKTPQGKTASKNCYIFVEFEDEAAIERVQQLVKKRNISISSKVYLAGTQTYTVIRRSKRKNAPAKAKANVTVLDYKALRTQHKPSAAPIIEAPKVKAVKMEDYEEMEDVDMGGMFGDDEDDY